MYKLVINGGLPLNGSIKTSGSKNATLPIFFASILANGPLKLSNTPQLSDVSTTLRLLMDMGANFVLEEDGSIYIDSSNLTNLVAEYSLVKTMRASILTLGPMLSKYKKAKISLPGGCAIGTRPVNLHLDALEKMGAKIEVKNGYIFAEAKELIGTQINFDMISVTATENILKETYGIAVYQEQVMQIAQVVAGYTLGGADLLRRAMGKKKVEEMDAQRATFIEGAQKHELNQKQATELFDLLEKFAGYGFNKSHAAAYAMIAYQTGYLKAHYPSAFIAASMSADMNNTDNIHMLFDDCALNKITLLPPNINDSDYKFTPLDQNRILYGLGAIKGTGLSAIDIILAERKSNGPFTSLFDFASRLDLRKVNRKAFESLIRAGAFDQIHPNRASLLASVNLAITKAEQGHAHQGQNALFEEFETSEIPLIDSDIWEERKQLAEEKIALGFYFSNHPFKFYEKMIREFVPNRLSELKPRESPYLIAGIISVIRMRMTSRGKIAIITLDDGAGRIDVVVGNMVLVDLALFVLLDESFIACGRTLVV